jgi:hypothetical protein
MEAQNDVEVHLSDGIPKTFANAYAAVGGSGQLCVWRWGTRHAAKRLPIAEYPPGRWAGYEHKGEQGDEPFETVNTAPAVTGSALTPGIEEALGDPVRGPRHEHPFDWNETMRSPEPGVPQNLQPALVRPALPPKDFKVPTHELPQRIPGADDQTQVIAVVDEHGALDRFETVQDAPRMRGWRREKVRRGQFPGGGVWVLAAAVFVSILASVRY